MSVIKPIIGPWAYQSTGNTTVDIWGYSGASEPAPPPSTLNVYFGTSNPTNLYFGNTLVQSLYLGSTLVWQK